MGNCQTAELATVVIQHPGGRLERVYWSVSASEIMGSNPGHYVAVFVTPPSTTSSTTSSRPAQRHLKILRPDDTLHIGRVYRLVSFEEVLKEITAKKHTRLSKMFLSQEKDSQRKGKGRRQGGCCGCGGGPSSTSAAVETKRSDDQMEVAEEEEEEVVEETEEELQPLCSSGVGSVSSLGYGRRQWRPMLQTIAEVGN